MKIVHNFCGLQTHCKFLLFYQHYYYTTAVLCRQSLKFGHWYELTEYKLHQLVEPVVWHYNPKECFSVDPTLWLVYGQMFPRVWAGSAFKGANGSSAVS